MVAPFKRIKSSMLPSGTSWIFQFHHVNQFHCRLTQLRYCMAIPDDEATLWKAYKSFTANLQKILWSLEIFRISFKLTLDIAARFFLAKWYPFQWQHWWASTWSWKMVVFFKGVFYLKSSTKEVKAVGWNQQFPQRLVRRFFFAGAIWEGPMDSHGFEETTFPIKKGR